MVLPFKRALVTGGAGFIGSHLVAALVRRGIVTRVVDNLSTGHRDNLPADLSASAVLVGDICNSDLMVSAMDGIDVVFHLAAVVSVPESVADPLRTAQVNELGTLGILNAARHAGVRRVVFSSSSAVYGDASNLPVSETASPRPLSPYAVQKWTGEAYCRLFAEQFGLETVCLRYFNVFGPRQDPSSPYSGVISRFMACAVHHQAPVIYGRGDQTRDFVYVDDVVAANIQAAAQPVGPGETMNIGTGHATTIGRLWETIASKASSDIQPNFESPRVGDIHDSVADIRRAAARIGFTPAVPFDVAIDDTLRWYRRHAPLMAMS